MKNPTIVSVRHLMKGENTTTAPQERYIGILVNENGDWVQSPKIGEPICLAGEKCKSKWDFKTTESIQTMYVLSSRWLVVMEDGTQYLIENDRFLH